MLLGYQAEAAAQRSPQVFWPFFFPRNYVYDCLKTVMSCQARDFAYFIVFSYYYFKLVSFSSLLLPPDMPAMLPAYKVGHLGRFQGREKKHQEAALRLQTCVKLDLPKNPKAFTLGEYLILLLIIFNPFAFN